MPAKIDAELDLHGHTAASARDLLELNWSRRVWLGLRRVRIIHGTGAVLYNVVRRWADEKSVPWTLEEHNPGVTILQPALRREHAQGPTNFPFARLSGQLRAAFPAEEPGAAKDSTPNESSVRRPVKPAESRRTAEDLFAQEMERLEQSDKRSLHRRKQGL